METLTQFTSLGFTSAEKKNLSHYFQQVGIRSYELIGKDQPLTLQDPQIDDASKKCGLNRLAVISRKDGRSVILNLLTNTTYSIFSS